jgi:urease accessory protein
LRHSYAEPPFRVGRALRDNEGLHVIVASSAPGVFGGDCLKQTIIVESGARVRLTSQSATQVHANDAGMLATVASTYRVESGGHLECIWDPVIPFPDAQLDQQILIDVEDGATLLWSDALMGGREARGERWQFSRLAHELRLIRAGRLGYLERYDIKPVSDDLHRRWIADEACYFGTVLAIDPSVSRALASELHRQCGGKTGLRASADLLDQQLLLVRLASDEGVSFHDARRCAIEGLRSLTT